MELTDLPNTPFLLVTISPKEDSFGVVFTVEPNDNGGFKITELSCINKNKPASFEYWVKLLPYSASIASILENLKNDKCIIVAPEQLETVKILYGDNSVT